MRNLLCFLLLFLSNILSAQEDTTAVLLQEIEQCRIGWSWMERKDYARAAYYFDKLNVNEKEYSYLAHHALNRRVDKPSKTFGGLPFALWVEGSWMHHPQDNDIVQMVSYAEHDEELEGFSLRAGFSHEVGERVSLNHTLSFVNQPYRECMDVGGKNIYQEALDYQSVEYAISTDIYLPKNFVLSLFGRIDYERQEQVSFRLDTLATYVEDYKSNEYNGYQDYYWGYGGNGSGDWYDWSEFDNSFQEFVMENEPSYSEEKNERREVSYLVGIALRTYLKHHEWYARGSYLNHWRYRIGQASVGYIWYPKGNLNLYLKLKGVAFIGRRESRYPFLTEGGIGFRTFEKLWLDFSFLYGSQKGYEDIQSNVVYLLSDDTKYRITAEAIVPLNEQWSLYVDYRCTNRLSKVMEYDLEYMTRERSVFDHILSMGVKWNF